MATTRTLWCILNSDGAFLDSTDCGGVGYVIHDRMDTTIHADECFSKYVHVLETSDVMLGRFEDCFLDLQ